jgi:rhodanese-related sulfurtransferase
MVAEANAVVAAVSPAEAIRLIGADDVVFVDLRESEERDASGWIPGAVSVPRGMLEFYIDSDRPDRREVFHSGRKVVFYCAGGGRSALAARTAMEMGLEDVVHVAGGFRAWVKAGGPVIPPEAPAGS